MSSDTQSFQGSLLANVLSDDAFFPTPPKTMAEAGLSESFVESLVCKHLLQLGTSSGRNLASHIALPFGTLEPLFATMRTHQLLVHAGSAPFNDYYYTLTDKGRQQAPIYARACAYIGPAPVPLIDYVTSVDAQAISAEAVRRDKFESAFRDISVSMELFEKLGPAVNSGAGMFLYGAPGNGKSTLAKKITMCFGQSIWIPHAVIDDGQLIKVFDASYHLPIKSSDSGIVKSRESDTRWTRVRRPTVVVGGELTMDNLEIRHDPRSNISEAPLQMKSNCGCLLIDDFGRQRIAPAELLNRWIVPLENRCDFLTLSTGKKIHVPFEQLIIFSTNLEPAELVDEAFLRRIPYKIEIGDPDEAEFTHLFELAAAAQGIEFRADAIDHLLARHYRPVRRAMRRCHPRDLLRQICAYCTYRDLPAEMRPEYFDRVASSYFAMVLAKK
jgi:predicted ATPase with chaperone activity